MRLTERKLAILTGVFFAAAMTNISQNGDQIVASLARMSDEPSDAVYTSAYTASVPAPSVAAQATPTGAAMAATMAAATPAVATFAVATGAAVPVPIPAAYLVAEARPEVAVEPAPVPARVPTRAVATGAVLSGDLALPRDTDTSVATLPSRHYDLSVRLAALDTERVRPLSDADMGLSPYGTPCSISLSASARPGAMASLSLDAPCLAGERIEITQGALRFAARTDSFGRFTAKVPALSEHSLYLVHFESGQTASVVVFSPDATSVGRVVLQWSGPVDLDMHALEYGADFGEAGDVWSGAARSALSAARIGGGFLTSLGDAALNAPMRAEVYTLAPTATGAARGGVVEVLIEALGDARGCAHRVEATAYRTMPGADADKVDLHFEMPPCGEAGQSLVFADAVQDLTVAQN